MKEFNPKNGSIIFCPIGTRRRRKVCCFFEEEIYRKAFSKIYKNLPSEISKRGYISVSKNGEVIIDIEDNLARCSFIDTANFLKEYIGGIEKNES